MTYRRPRRKIVLVGAAAVMVLTGLVSTLSWASEPVCQTPWPEGEEVAHISDAEINESSGMADSWLHADRLWTHNDSGDEPRLWAMEKDGTVTTEVTLEGAENVDWEDMAIAPCGDDDDNPCIYIGDFGDNNAVRDEVVIYRFPEPELGDEPPDELVVSEVETLVYRYDGGPRNAETLLVHPETAQIWVVEKTGASEVDVFAVDNNFDSEEVQIAAAVATMEIPGFTELVRMITAGDISPDGTEITIRAYLDIYTYCVDDFDDLESAFAAEPTRFVADPATIQGEALTYDRLDGSLWLTSEQLPAPLIRLPPREGEPEEGDSDAAEPPPEDVDAGTDDSSESSEDSESTESGCSTIPASNSVGFFAVFMGLVGWKRWG